VEGAARAGQPGYEAGSASVLAETRDALSAANLILRRYLLDPGDQRAAAEMVHLGHRLADVEASLDRVAASLLAAPHMIALGRQLAAAEQAPGRHARRFPAARRALRAVPVIAAIGAGAKAAVTAHRAATASLALAASVVTAGGLTLAVQPYQTQTVPPQPAVTQAAALAPAAAFPSAVPAVVTHKRRHRPRRAVTSPAPQPATAPPPSSPPPSPSASPSPGVLAVSSPVLQLEGGTGQVALTAQGGQVSWEASAPGWVFLSPASGSLADGETVTVTVTCHREGPGSAVVTFAPGVAVQVTWGG